MEGIGDDAMGDLDDTDDEGNKSIIFCVHLYIYFYKHKLLHLTWVGIKYLIMMCYWIGFVWNLYLGVDNWLLEISAGLHLI